ncbi:uncharacterized protein I303_101134 [Kwoniella dejecticola CBS 10117]|uniref:Uncharacterized protein n=1 Tax=Kwoniella dejecticola CBS 10117 TaxID=1296121 RepID=A0A1A6AGX6_9TREE|nr:uncharacterized protein I303_01140 [Kwoniella dejecticola CBS 10117]OBR89314.1 hypothetical protein I303_01140 [Kwoniella dejecticola CBS 10117]
MTEAAGDAKLPIPTLGSGGLFTVISEPSTTRYTLGYRRVFLRPTDATQLQEAILHIPPDTVAFDVSYGDKTAKSIEIIADELIIVGGTSYEYLEHNLSIRCRSLSYIPRQSSQGLTLPVEFRVSGKDAQDPGVDGKPGDPGDDATAPISIQPSSGFFHPQKVLYDYSKSTTRSTVGRPGHQGQPGLRGGDSGDFSLAFYKASDSLVSAATSGSPAVVHVYAVGGAGSKGGQGGEGGSGGRGLQTFSLPSGNWNGEELQNFTQFMPLTFGGANGGDGGPPGPGGRGGNGGKVTVASASWLDKYKSLFEIQTSGGAAGSIGGIGPGGAGGLHADIGEPDSPGSWWIHLHIATAGGKLWSQDPAGQGYADDLNKWIRPPRGNLSDLDKDNGSKGNDSTMIDPDALWKLVDAKDQQSQTAQGSSSLCHVTDQAAAQFFANDSFFFYFLLNRLTFEYFIHISSQMYNDAESGGKELTPGQQAFKDLLSFVQGMLANLTTGQNKAVDILKSNFSILQSTVQNRVDVFGNSFSYVPVGRVGVLSLQDIIKEYQITEEAFNIAQSALESSQRDRLILADKIQSAKDKIATNQGKKKDEQRNLQDIRARIFAYLPKVDEAKHELFTQVKGLEAAIKLKVGCDYKQVIDAVSTVLLFTDPATSGLALAGTVLSVGVSEGSALRDNLFTLTSDTGAKIEKSLLYSRLDSVADDGKGLKNDIAATLQQSKEQRAADNSYLHGLLVDQAKFQTMSDSYFTDIPDSAKVKQAFTALIQTLQQKNQLISDYNASAVRLANLQLQALQQNQYLASFQQATGMASDDEVQTALSFLRAARSQMGQLVFEKIYAFCRAFNCATLGPTSVFRALAPFQSFGSITSDHLHIDVYGQLQKDIDVWFNNWGHSPRITFVQEVNLTDQSSPHRLEAFRKNRSLELDLDWQEAQNHGISSKNFDMRLVDLKVFLDGATVDLNKVPLAERTKLTSQRIRLSIECTGTYRYIDNEQGEHMFDFPYTGHDFFYTNPDLTGKLVNYSQFSTTIAVEGDKFAIGLQDTQSNKVVQYPLQSPLAVWTIKPYDEVDLTKVRGIKFVFTINTRSHTST